jgi:formate hydrogenlyase subunit 6/NADH:ubiquinone oxidoreductase subunit I
MTGYKKFRPKMLAEVIKALFKTPATINYPAEKLKTPDGFRGRIIFNSDSCIGCKMCMRDCPAGAIRIEPTGVEKKFKCTFLLDRCLFCAQCVDSCPRKALTGSTEFELTCFERDQFEDVQE